MLSIQQTQLTSNLHFQGQPEDVLALIYQKNNCSTFVVCLLLGVILQRYWVFHTWQYTDDTMFICLELTRHWSTFVMGGTIMEYELKEMRVLFNFTLRVPFSFIILPTLKWIFWPCRFIIWDRWTRLSISHSIMFAYNSTLWSSCFY